MRFLAGVLAGIGLCALATIMLAIAAIISAIKSFFK